MRDSVRNSQFKYFAISIEFHREPIGSLCQQTELKNTLIPISYARSGRHFLIETESNEGKGDDFATMSNKGDDHATMANKGDDHARKANKGDDYADYVKEEAKGKTKSKANAKAKAEAIAKAKLKLLQALKANKGDDYASKPKFDTARFLASCS